MLGAGTFLLVSGCLLFWLWWVQTAVPDTPELRRPSALAARVKPPPSPPPPPPIPHTALVRIERFEYISDLRPSPTRKQVVALATRSNESDSAFYLLDVEGNAPRTIEIASHFYPQADTVAAWSPDGNSLYYMLFDGECGFLRPRNRCGVFRYDVASGKRTLLFRNGGEGLTLSPDGTLLAYWGDNGLSVFDLQKGKKIRAWRGLVNGWDDYWLNRIVFSPDGRAIYAQLYGRGEPWRLFDIESGKSTQVISGLQSAARVGDRVYFLRFQPVPYTNPEHNRELWIIGDDGVARKLWTKPYKDFPYQDLQNAGDSRRLLVSGYHDLDFYDPKTDSLNKAGGSCTSAAVLRDGTAVFAFGNEIVRDRKVCAGPKPQ